MREIRSKTPLSANTLLKRKLSYNLNGFNAILLYLLSLSYEIILQQIHKIGGVTGNFLIAKTISENGKVIYEYDDEKQIAWYIDPFTNDKITIKMESKKDNQRLLYPFQIDFLTKLGRMIGIECTYKCHKESKRIEEIISKRFGIHVSTKTIDMIYEPILNDINIQKEHFQRGEKYVLKNNLFRPIKGEEADTLKMETNDLKPNDDTQFDMEIDSKLIPEIPFVVSPFYNEDDPYFNQDSFINYGF